MRAGRRLAWGIAAVAALVAAHAPAHAQDAPPEANESGSIGPRELDNFTINGTVTQPAPQRPAPAPPATRPQRAAQPPAAAAPPSARPAPADTSQAERERPTPDQQASRPAPSPQDQPLRQAAPSSSVTAVLPDLDSGGEAAATAQDVPVPDVPA